MILVLILTAAVIAIMGFYTGAVAGYAHGCRDTEADIGHQAGDAWDAAARAVNELDQARRDMRVGFIAVPDWDAEPVRGIAISSAEAEAFIASLAARTDNVIEQLTAEQGPAGE